MLPETAEDRSYQRKLARRTLPKVRTLVTSDMADELAYDYAKIRREDRENRLVIVKQGKCPPMYAVAVRTTREYGGPEEGGWWYDFTTIEEVRRAFTFRSLLSNVRKLQEEYPTSRYGRHSCADRSGDVTIFMLRSESMIDGLQTTERPRYE
jgi:hypothetical protein